MRCPWRKRTARASAEKICRSSFWISRRRDLLEDATCQKVALEPQYCQADCNRRGEQPHPEQPALLAPPKQIRTPQIVWQNFSLEPRDFQSGQVEDPPQSPW